jgi:ABC-2 type transport system permease protein
VIQAIRRRVTVYGAMAALVPKFYTAYAMWFWMSLVMNVITMSIYVFFWRAVYAESASLAGLDVQQTLRYILLAAIFGPLSTMFLIQEFGYNLREGGIAHALLRPVDLQGSLYVQFLGNLALDMIMQLPLALVATLVFGLRWPADPLVWGAFLVAALLGRTVLFFFDWTLACLTFYTTEIWGLWMLVSAVNMFFSGMLVPLVMMPDWLQAIAHSMPFAQALFVPISLLSGLEPLSSAPRHWLVQIAWILGLGVLSRLVFNRALRVVTVQGG